MTTEPKLSPCAWCGCAPDEEPYDYKGYVAATCEEPCFNEFEYCSTEYWNTLQTQILARRKADFEAGAFAYRTYSPTTKPSFMEEVIETAFHQYIKKEREK